MSKINFLINAGEKESALTYAGILRGRQNVAIVALALERAVHVDAVPVVAHPRVLTFIVICVYIHIKRNVKKKNSRNSFFDLENFSFSSKRNYTYPCSICLHQTRRIPGGIDTRSFPRNFDKYRPGNIPTGTRRYPRICFPSW